MRILACLLAMWLVPTLAAAQDVWRVAYNHFPPYSFQSETGDADGYAIDLIRALAATRGVEIEFAFLANPGEIVAALGDGSVDVSVALARTPARQEHAIFSVPHQSVRIRLYAPAESAAEVAARWPDGVRVGFAKGAYPAVVVSRYPTAIPLEGTTNPDVLLNLMNQEIDAAIYPDTGFRRLVEAFDTRRRFIAVGDILDEVPLHLATSISRPVLAETLSADLSSFIVTEEYSNIVQRWFGEDAATVWATRTVLMLVGAVAAVVAIAALVGHYYQRRRAEAAMVAFAQEKAEVEQRAAEQLRSRNNRLEKKMSELEELLYVVSHDLSSPLVSISGFSRNAMRAIGADQLDRARELLVRVEANVRGMSRLINGVLSVSRIGQETTHTEDFQLPDIVDEIAMHLDGLLDARNVRLVCDQDATLTTDRHLFGRALQNLVENAVKYGCPHDKNVVRIIVDEAGNRLRIGVLDNGPGIPQHLRSRIFLMYRRLQSDDSGSGLGLSIVSKIAERLEASVYVDGSTETGALFWIDFDASEQSQRKQAA
ncbi:MAG: transporter substrate-binding domain-containing protein [Silicimonas sp.]|nr:transporter substrate-binding domain-containing protein [Silicimonas sp.]